MVSTEVRQKDKTRQRTRTTLTIGILTATLIVGAQALAGLASNDLAGQLRATPQATMGALEVMNAISGPSTPDGLSISIL